MRTVLALLLLSLPGAAQLRPSAAGALNSASFADPASAGGSLARGGIFSIFGTQLALEQAAAVEFPIAVRLADVEVEATVDGVTRKALPLFVRPDQINAVLPSDLPAGAGELVVIVRGVRSAPLSVRVADHAPGIYTLRGSGAGPAVMTDPLDADLNRRINSGLRAAHPGEPWDLWATGMGPIPTNDAERAPFFDRTDWDVRVLVGGREAPVVYRGRSGCCSGLDQVRFLVPEGVQGCCVPVELVVNGVVSNTASMSINGPGKRLCETDLLADIPDELVRFFNGEEEFRTGSIGLTRSRAFTEPEGGLQTAAATVLFSAYRFVSTVFDPCLETTSGLTGPCTVIRPDATIVFDLDGNELGRSANNAAQAQAARGFAPAPPVDQGKLMEAAMIQARTALPTGVEQQDELPFRFLDVGPSVSLDGPGRNWELARSPDGPFSFGPVYSVEIMSDQPFTGAGDGSLPGGGYTFRAPGGPDLSGFSVAVSTENLEWANYRDAFPEIRRDRPLRLNWRGDPGDVGVVSVSGSSARGLLDFSLFFCTADFGAGGLTLHPNMLREMYASQPAGAPETGSLAVGLGAGRLETVSGIENVSVGYGEVVSVHSPYTGEGYEPPGLRFAVKVPPVYPPAARQAGIEGVVRATLLVGPDGVPQLFGIEGPDILADAVRAVVPQWRIEGAGLIPLVEAVATFRLAEGVTCELRQSF